MRLAKIRRSTSGANSPKKHSSPLSKAASKAPRNNRLNKRASAFTGNKKPGANDPALAVERDAAAAALGICRERHGRIGGGGHQPGVNGPVVLEGYL
jgi:hypothetical protein